MSKLTLQTLILIVALWMPGLNAYAQNLPPEVEEVLTECELVTDALVDQRNRAIQAADRAAQERDEARGKLLFLVPEYETLKDENLRLHLKVAEAPNRWVWLGVGVGAGVATTVLVSLVLVSL